MNVICFEDKAFFEMLDRLYERYQGLNSIKQEKWVSGDEAMKLLGIKSKTTLQNYRDEGKIRFTQPTPKVILYDRESINTFLENNAINIF
jgi:hypothetical protein